MGEFIRITPFMQVRDIKSAVAFFCDILGFSRYDFPFGDYAYVYRSNIAVRILQSKEAVIHQGGYSIYIDLGDIDAFYQSLKPKLDTLPDGHVHGPIDQFYGQRELLIKAPDGSTIVFGQEIFRHDTSPVG